MSNPCRLHPTSGHLHPSLVLHHKEEAFLKAPCIVGVVPPYQGLHTNLPLRLSIEKGGPGSFLPDSHPPMCQIDVVSSGICAQPQSPHMYIQAHLACLLSARSHICPWHTCKIPLSQQDLYLHNLHQPLPLK